MTWNNRIIRKIKRNPIKNGKPKVLHYYDVHEVYYDRNGKPNGWTQEPIIGGYETVKELQQSIAHIALDCLRWPVLEIKKTAGKMKLEERNI